MTSSEINLIISYESQEKETLKCNSNEKLENVLEKFKKEKNIEDPSLMILYGGKTIQEDDLKKSLFQIMTGRDKHDSTMNILLYKNATKIAQDISNINIKLIINSRNAIVLQGKREDKLRDILIRNGAKINMNINSLIFKYRNKDVDIDKKFDQIVNITDNNLCEMTLKAYTQKKFFVNFIYNNFRQFRIECKTENNIRYICNIFCNNFGKNINELTFRYNYFNINLDQTFKDLLSDNDDLSSKNNIIDQEEDPEENRIKEINIIVINNESFMKKYKKLIIIITIVLIIIIIIIIVVSSSNGKQKEKEKGGSDSGDETLYSPKETDKINDSTKETDKINDSIKEIDKINDSTKETDKINDSIKETDKINDSTKETDKINDSTKEKDKINDSTKETDKTNYSTKETDKINDSTKETDKTNYSPKETDKINDSTKETDKTNDSTKETEAPTTKQIKTCNPGYFIPLDDETLEDCQKCSLDKCIKCNGTYDNNDCISCGDLENIYENGKIIECKNTCETGPGEKCLTCYEDKIACKSCNTGYKLVNRKCRPDFLIEAVYQTKANGDLIDLLSVNNAVIQMIIDGKIITDISNNRKYRFMESGNHTVYFKFQKRDDYYSHKTGLFSTIEKLISAVFSDFDEYFSDISFEGLFNQCSNLISVDLSKIAINTKSSTAIMFSGCVNLVYVNFNLDSFRTKQSMVNMFKDCRSLKSIDLSKFDVSEVTNFNEMFSGCTSLTSVDLGNFKLDYSGETSMEKMFKDCISLEYLDLSSFQPFQLTTISSTFYNCHSLTSINLKNFYTSRTTSMSYTFYNCTSLKFIDLSSFNTEKVDTIEGMFEHCTSLTSINFGSNFNTKRVSKMSNLFYHCHSLESIDYPIIANNIDNLTFFFSDCYSITSVNLQKFNITTSRFLQNMFRNCYNLKNIDFSIFRFTYNTYLKNMFSGCYSLTSVNFSKANSIDSSFDKIFYDCPNLNFVNFSFCTDSLGAYVQMFNENISSNGTLILRSSLRNSNNLKPVNWILELI